MKSRQNNPQNNNGFTPMHRAAFLGDVSTVNALGGGGGGGRRGPATDETTNAPDNIGRTPLHFAAKRGHVDVVQALSALGANVNATDVDGCTPECSE